MLVPRGYESARLDMGIERLLLKLGGITLELLGSLA